jgi:hypothetical protein
MAIDGVPIVVRNSRRRLRRQRRSRRRAERAWVESELADPSPGIELDSNFGEHWPGRNIAVVRDAAATGGRIAATRPLGRSGVASVRGSATPTCPSPPARSRPSGTRRSTGTVTGGRAHRAGVRARGSDETRGTDLGAFPRSYGDLSRPSRSTGTYAIHAKQEVRRLRNEAEAAACSTPTWTAS